MDDTLAERVEALERTVTDGDHDLTALTAKAEALDRLADLDTQLGALTDRVAELEATTQALRGYVGNIRAVNQDVEKRADAALAKVEQLETTHACDDASGAQPRSEATTHSRQSGQQIPSSTDGSVDPARTEPTSPCRVCGRTAENTSKESADTSRHTDSPVQSAETADILVPETTETGPLQRLREIL